MAKSPVVPGTTDEKRLALKAKSRTGQWRLQRAFAHIVPTTGLTSITPP